MGDHYHSIIVTINKERRAHEQQVNSPPRFGAILDRLTIVLQKLSSGEINRIEIWIEQYCHQHDHTCGKSDKPLLIEHDDLDQVDISNIRDLAHLTLVMLLGILDLNSEIHFSIPGGSLFSEGWESRLN